MCFLATNRESAINNPLPQKPCNIEYLPRQLPTTHRMSSLSRCPFYRYSTFPLRTSEKIPLYCTSLSPFICSDHPLHSLRPLLQITPSISSRNQATIFHSRCLGFWPRSTDPTNKQKQEKKCQAGGSIGNLPMVREICPCSMIKKVRANSSALQEVARIGKEKGLLGVYTQVSHTK